MQYTSSTVSFISSNFGYVLLCLLFRAQVSVSLICSWVPLKAALPFVAPFLPSPNHCSCTCLGIAFPPLPQNLVFSRNSPARGHVPQLRERCFDYRLLAFVQISLDQHISVLFVGNGLCLKIFILLTSGGFLFVFRKLLIYQTLSAK